MCSYEPLCDRLFSPDPSQKNPVARPFRITPLLTEYLPVHILPATLPASLPTAFFFVATIAALDSHTRCRFVDPLLAKLAPILPPMCSTHIHTCSHISLERLTEHARYAMAIFKAIYAAVLVAFDRSIFNGGEHKCLDKTDIIFGDVPI